MGKTTKYATLFVLIFTLIAIVFYWNHRQDRSVGEFNKEEQASLKIMYFSESDFLNKFGGMFQVKYPNVTVEVAPMANVFNSAEKYYEILDEFIEEHHPDILLLNPESYAKYSGEGRLYNLDTLIASDRFDIQNMAPSVIEVLTRSGGGALHGLTPQFANNALFFNRKLFDEYGVPYPTDRMSWQDVVSLAQRFPHNDDIYGLEVLSSASPFFLFTNMLQTHGLVPFDAEQKRVTVLTPSWKNLLSATVQAKQSGILLPPRTRNPQPMSPGDYLKSFPFIAGKTAMYFSGSSFLRELNLVEQTWKEDVLDWDVVTAPVDPQQRDYSANYSLMNIYAISANTTHLRPAWELIKFIHSEEMAKILAVTEDSLLPSRTNQIKKWGDRNLKAFWTLKPQENTGQAVPLQLSNSFWLMARPEIEAALNGTQSVDESLSHIQEKGEKLLVE
ncbi:extracellular solute-binding protein [Paenibacillus hodogayensis]|uniref:Extracellular solute-binding protein n=1 Tax=Paenibacillus hodogayensis TaxID=279208 RepID=A0ABV5VUS8_9BACL